MRYIIAAFLLMGAFVAQGQSVVPLRGDTIKIYKVGGFAELVVQNRTKDSLGIMINTGNGKTEFRRAKKLDSTHIIIGLDTLEVGSGGSDSAIAAQYGIKIVVVGTTRYLVVDSNAVISHERGTKIADSLAAVFNAALVGKLSAVSVTNSITGNGTSGTPIKLVNDAATPGNSKYYGTDVGGSKGYFNLPTSSGTDTITAVTPPLKISRTGNTVTIGGDSIQNKKNVDIYSLPVIRISSSVSAVAATATVANYPYTSIDSGRMYLTVSNIGSTGDRGGILWSGTSGDSMRIKLPSWVLGGHSVAAGHTTPSTQISRLETLPFDYTYADNDGQISYILSRLMHMKMYNHGIGSETSFNLRNRWARDMLGDSVITSSAPGGVTRTLSSRPQGVLIIEGINDFAANANIDSVKQNFEYFAASCQQNNMYCVILTAGGYGLLTKAQLKTLEAFNQWLLSGALDKWGACIVNYQTFWNDARMDNIHPSTFIASDLIHPTNPTGYDSLARYIFKQAHMPVLTKLVITSNLDPTNPVTGFSRPTSITIGGIPFTLGGTGQDTILINTYLGGDSVWLKVTGSTNISGTTQNGFSSGFKAIVENDLDTASFTRRTAFSNSAAGSEPNLSALNIVAKNNNNNNIVMNVKGGDQNTILLRMTSDQAEVGRVYVNGTAAINGTDRLSVYGGISSSNGLSTAANSNNRLGPFQIGNTATASALARGINYFNNAMQFEMYTGDVFNFSIQGGANWGVPGLSSGLNVGHILDTVHVGSVQDNDTISILKLKPTWNNLSTGKNHGFSNIIFVKHDTLTSKGNQTLTSFWNWNGDNYLNSNSGRTMIGGAYAQDDGYTKAQVIGTAKITDTFKTPNIVRKLLDTTNYKPEVVDGSGNHFKTDWAVFSASSGQRFVATADKTAANTTSLVDLVPTGTGSNTIPANTLAVGTTIVMKGYLLLTTKASGTVQPNLHFFAFGGTYDGGFPNFPNSLSNSPLYFEAYVTCRTTGASGTLVGYARYTDDTGVVMCGGSVSRTINTTISNDVGLGITWDTADPSNSITTKFLEINIK